MKKSLFKKVGRDQILSGNLWKTILLLSLPVLFNAFLQSVYNLTDTYWLGQLGTEELAAINLVTPMQNLVINLGSGITVAASVLLAQYMGARQDEDAKSMANQIFVCAMIFAVVFGGGCSLLSPAILRWLGAEGQTFESGKIYLQLVMLDIPFLFVVNMFTSIHQAEGDTVSPMLLNLLGICINFGADPLLMVHFHLGTAGAALATLLAKSVPAVIAFVSLHNTSHEIYLDLRKLHFEKEKMKLIVTVGLPSAIGGSFQQLGFLLLSRHVMQFGTQAMAAYGVGTKVNSLLSLPSSSGLNSAVAIVAGQNFGAGQMKRAVKGLHISCVCAVLFLLIGGVILSRPMIAAPVLGIFTDDPETVKIAVEFLGIMTLWCFVNGVTDTVKGFFKGLGRTFIPVAVDVARIWLIRFVVLYICEGPLHLGVKSVWLSIAISNAIAALILLILYLSGIWKNWKPQIKKKHIA